MSQERLSGAHVEALGTLLFHPAPDSGSAGLGAGRTLSSRVTHRHGAVAPVARQVPALNIDPGDVVLVVEGASCLQLGQEWCLKAGRICKSALGACGLKVQDLS